MSTTIVNQTNKLFKVTRKISKLAITFLEGETSALKLFKISNLAVSDSI